MSFIPTFSVSNQGSGSFGSGFMVGDKAIAGSISDNGLYYSSDGGVNWTQSNVTSGYVGSVFMVGDKAIAGTYGSGLYYSSNSGVNWTQVTGPGSTGFFFSVFMVGTNAIAGTYGYGTGLYYSSNSGVTWTQVTGVGSTGNFRCLFMVGDNAVAGTNANNGLYYSSNGGQTWTQSNVTSGPFNFIFMVSRNNIAGSGSNNGLYYSINIVPPIPCFKSGTKILTDNGYKRIEELRKGDLVKTLLHDYKPIYMIGKKDIYHPSCEERIKDQLYKCSKDKFGKVFEPLIITGCHSILVDDFVSEEQREKAIETNGGRVFVTDNKYRLPACADERASVYESPGNYTIYHLALENDNYYHNYGIYANGLLVETCSKRYLKELSGMFHL